MRKTEIPSVHNHSGGWKLNIQRVLSIPRLMRPKSNYGAKTVYFNVFIKINGQPSKNKTSLFFFIRQGASWFLIAGHRVDLVCVLQSFFLLSFALKTSWKRANEIFVYILVFVMFLHHGFDSWCSIHTQTHTNTHIDTLYFIDRHAPRKNNKSIFFTNSEFRVITGTLNFII